MFTPENLGNLADEMIAAHDEAIADFWGFDLEDDDIEAFRLGFAAGLETLIGKMRSHGDMFSISDGDLSVIAEEIKKGPIRT